MLNEIHIDHPNCIRMSEQDYIAMHSCFNVLFHYPTISPEKIAQELGFARQLACKIITAADKGLFVGKESDFTFCPLYLYYYYAEVDMCQVFKVIGSLEYKFSIEPIGVRKAI